MNISKVKTEKTVLLVLYYITLSLFFTASIYSEYRVWGFHHWGFYPFYTVLMVFGFGALVPFTINMFIRSGLKGFEVDSTNNRKSSNCLIISLIIIIVSGIVFYLLRARMHLLGDGYALLANLSSINPLIKFRNIGEALIHIFLYKQLNGAESSLLSYQLLSYAGGLIFLSVTALSGKALFKLTYERILFLLGLGSGGYMLLYFGYVENYSLFVTMVAVYGLMGLLVVKGRLNRWLILIPLALSIFFHIFGVALIPSAVYLFLINTKLSAALLRLNKWIKLFLITVGFIIIGSIFYYYYTTELFFRFAFVPLIENRFTVEGYTLFSLNHLLDIFNLAILLLPAFPIMIALLFFLPVKRIFILQDYKFLLILLISTLGVIFIFDPKMGMPRDWDLFAFAGVPLAIFCFYLILDNKSVLRNPIPLLMISVMLNIFILAPRVVSQIIPDIAIAQFKNYSHLDVIKNRLPQVLLVNYYRDIGDTIKAEIEKKRCVEEFVEGKLIDSANVLLTQNKFWEAVNLNKKALEINPMFVDAYINLGDCYMSYNAFERGLSYYEIANGLNPYSIAALNNMGYALFNLEQFKKAEKALKRVLKMQPSNFSAMFNLIRLYQDTNQIEKYYYYLRQLVTHEDASGELIKLLGDYYLNQKNFKDAMRTYGFALKLGLDSSYIDNLLIEYPDLNEYLTTD